MARIDLENVAHSYDPDASEPVFALRECNLHWRDGGRFAVLGPSGCGKTTMLNIMSGIIRPSRGRILFDKRDVTDITTAERNIAQVFQFPVIYNTMTVRKNLSFPLICRDMDRAAIDRKVAEVADTLGLGGVLDHAANRLTADQKQLISLGRGLVREDVSAILMDEPLTVIDPDLKFRLRRKLKEINALYKSTLIYVTHDQNEAMTFAEDIVVMDEGSIVQIGSPRELFERPRTTFVGYFIGNPAMNMFSVRIDGRNSVALDDARITTATDLGGVKTGNVKLGIRSENITVASRKTRNGIAVGLERSEDFGNFRLLTTRFNDKTIKVKTARDTAIPGDRLWLVFPEKSCCVYADEMLV